MSDRILFLCGFCVVLLATLYLLLAWPHEWWEFVVLAVVFLVVVPPMVLGAVSAVMWKIGSEIASQVEECHKRLEREFTSAIDGGLQVTSVPLPLPPEPHWAVSTPREPETDALNWDDFLQSLESVCRMRDVSGVASNWGKVFNGQTGALIVELPTGRVPYMNDAVIVELGLSMFSPPVPRPPLLLGIAERVEHVEGDGINIVLTPDSEIRPLFGFMTPEMRELWSRNPGEN